MSRPTCTSVRIAALPVSLALVALLAAARPAAADNEGFPHNAFLFEARLGLGVPTTLPNAGALGATTTAGVVATPALLVGARLLDRLHLGLGFGFFRLQFESAGQTSAANLVTFAPTVAVDLAKSKENRVAFYFKGALPMGPAVTCQPAAPCDNNFSIGFDFGLGARYALHPMFALGLETGVAGSFLGPQRNNTVGVVNVYGALVGSFFLGK
jgi:hypothetical protein